VLIETRNFFCNLQIESYH